MTEGWATVVGWLKALGNWIGSVTGWLERLSHLKNWVNKNVDSTFNWRQLVALWCVTCNAFIKTIELYFTWAFQKYMTHGVFSKIVCNLIFVTCNMCDMLHVTHVTCKNFIMTIQLYFAWAFQKCMTHRVFSKLV